MEEGNGWTRYGAAHVGKIEGLWGQAWRAGPATVFQTFDFARHWMATFSQAEVEIWVHTTSSLVLPLARRDGTVSLVGEGLFDYCDLIGPAPYGTDGPVLQQAAEIVMAGNARPRATGVRADSRFSDFWRRLGEGRYFSAAPQRPADAGALGHTRIARRWQRAEHAGVRAHEETEMRERRATLDWILERKQHHPANMLGELERQWIETVVEHSPHLAEVWSLRRGEHIMSGLLCWRCPPTRYCYTIAHEPSDAALSPGILLLYFVVNRSMSSGWDIDFLTGEQAFKLRFATRRQPLHRYGF
ncbi:MAG TPA: GNAT family N-acetyltransferase [Terriglobales bacterium]|nr:GNAT family N-acetyltransferase [Terriglobales bacterium]